MSRRFKLLLFLAVVILVGAFTVRNVMWEPPPVPAVIQPQAGLQCFREGGDHDYCRCLDHLESARAAAGLPTPEFPGADIPAIREALRRPDRYPIVTADTLRCLTHREAPLPRRAIPTTTPDSQTSPS